MKNKDNYLLVWDLDDTIYQQSDQFNKSTNRLLNKEIFDDNKGYEIFKKYSEITFEEFKNGLFNTEEMRIQRIKRTLIELGYPISRDQAILWQEYYLEEQYSLTLSKNMEKILDECKEKNIELGIITNGPSQHQRRKIEALNLEKWISEDMIVVSGDDNVHKPDQRIFKKFSKNITGNYRVVYIGDNYENDILGAYKFGWDTVWFNLDGKENISQNKATYEVENYEDLHNLIHALIK